MKKIFIITLFLFLFPVVGFAAPFLVCDVYPTASIQPTYFSLVKDGGVQDTSLPETVTGAVRLHYDLATVTNGVHSWTVAACNDWGCSIASPFAFTKTVPAGPAGLRLEK